TLPTAGQPSESPEANECGAAREGSTPQPARKTESRTHRKSTQFAACSDRSGVGEAAPAHRCKARTVPRPEACGQSCSKTEAVLASRQSNSRTAVVGKGRTADLSRLSRRQMRHTRINGPAVLNIN